jgi:perosamine synthetase
MMVKVPVAKPYLDEAEEEAVVSTLRSGWISQGPRCVEFERALADFVGVKHGRAVNSGTSALHLALLACGIGPGDEVIVPAFTCVATLNPIEHIGARPVVVDIHPDTYGLDSTNLATAITPRTRAVIVVHLFGLAADIEAVVTCAAAHNLKVIEDAALGLGARVGSRQVGSFGDAACLSFHPRKMITTGEGGMVLANSEQIAARVAELRNYGASVPAWERHKRDLFALPAYEEAGFNFKLTDIQASIGLEQLRKLPTILALRRELACRYDAALADLPWLQLPCESAGRTHAYQSYVCLLRTDVSDLDALEALRLRFWRHLADQGVTSVQGAQSMPTVAFYRRKYGWQPQDFPLALRADKGSVALPIYPGMTTDEQQQVIQSVRSFLP